MAAASLEHRIATVARAMAISLNEPEPIELARLAQAPALHATTRRRIEHLHRFQEALRAGYAPDEIELQLIETMVEALETLLCIHLVPEMLPQPEREIA